MVYPVFRGVRRAKYDTFGTGHSSTSIGAALGMAAAAKQQRIRRHVVAVIGDAAMSAGMAFEALNHAGGLDLDILVVLNDNDMSISSSSGAFSNHLARVFSGESSTRPYARAVKRMSRLPNLRRTGRAVGRTYEGVW